MNRQQPISRLNSGESSYELASAPLHRTWLTGVALLSLLAMCTVGCTEPMDGPGGGAYAPSTVEFKPLADAESVEPATGGGDAAAGPTKAGGYGTFKGRIVLGGGVPSLPPTIVKSQIKDAAVCVYDKIPHQENLIVAADGGVANVFIYLQKTPKGGKEPEGEAEPVLFDQKTCTFKPHAMSMIAGQTVLVLNSDPVLHNTHTFPARNSSFNKGVLPNEQDGVPLVYTRPEKEPVRVQCDIHPWMSAWHLPLDHPYVAVTGADGSFEIPNLPAGKHEFIIWHEINKKIESAYEVTIEADGTTEKMISLPGDSFAQFRRGNSNQVVLGMTR